MRKNVWYLSLCMCVHVCSLHVGTQVQRCECSWGHILRASHLMALHFIYWGGLLQNPEFTGWCSSVSQLVLGIPCSSLPRAGITGSHSRYVRSGNSSSSRHTCTTSVLSRATSPATDTSFSETTNVLKMMISSFIKGTKLDSSKEF